MGCKKRSAAIVFSLVSLLLFPFPNTSAQTLTADELVRKMDELLRGETSYSKMKMLIYNPDWPGPREIEMSAYESVKDSKSFIRIIAPARDRGTGFLKIGFNLWMYVPATERVMKMPPSMMHESWMGSDFTNDDLVRESSIVKDYEHKLIGVDDHPEAGKTYKLELVPKPGAAVVWGRILVWVWDQGFVPLKQQYFDEQGKMISEMIFSGLKPMAGRKIPTVWEMHSMTKPGHKTVFQIEQMEFDLKIDPGIFTEKNLKSKNW